MRGLAAETLVQGRLIDVATAEKAGTAALANAIPLPYNLYKIQIAKAMVKKAILACC